MALAGACSADTEVGYESRCGDEARDGDTCPLQQSTEGDLDAVYDLICTLEDTRLPFARFVEIYRNQLSDPR